MNRQKKEAVVADCRSLVEESQATFLVNYRGVDVSGLQSLRRTLRDNDGHMKVTKARLMKIAVDGVDGIDAFRDELKDQVGLVFAKSDASTIAKELSNFSKDYSSFGIVAGFFEHRSLSKEQVNFLASLPSRDVLFGQIAGTLQAPISGFARLLNMMIVRLAFVLKQASEKGVQE